MFSNIIIFTYVALVGLTQSVTYLCYKHYQPLSEKETEA